jgi:hypothetical protein
MRVNRGAAGAEGESLRRRSREAAKGTMTQPQDGLSSSSVPTTGPPANFPFDRRLPEEHRRAGDGDYWGTVGFPVMTRLSSFGPERQR